MTKRVGILGGTFDPVHYAHLLIAQAALLHAGLDEVWFMPANIPPHKQKRQVSDAKHRLRMVELAIQDQPAFSVTDIELTRGGASYTIHTMQELVRQYPDMSFFFIIGGDMVEMLPKWYRFEELSKLVRFIGVGRPGSTYDKAKLSSVVTFVEAPMWELSSSFVRKQWREKKNLRYLVPPAVECYIKEHGLYESLGKSGTVAGFGSGSDE